MKNKKHQLKVSKESTKNTVQAQSSVSKIRSRYLFGHFLHALKGLVDLIILVLVAVVPYYIAEIYEGWITHLSVKGIDPHMIVHRDKTIWFAYVLAAIICVELCWYMLWRTTYDLNWHWPYIPIQIKNAKLSKWLKRASKVLHIFMDFCLLLISAVAPYTAATSYEGTITYLNVQGLSRFEISHLDKTMNFAYALAAAVTIKLLVFFARRIKQDFMKRVE